MSEIIRQTEGVPIHGEVRLHVIEGDLPSSEILDYIDSHQPTDIYVNTVTNIGRQQVTKLAIGETASYVRYTGLTTSATTPSRTLTALTNEIVRKANSVNASISSYYQRYVSYHATVDWGSTGIAGIGLFDTASTGGSMWAAASIIVSKTTTQSLITDYRLNLTT